MNLINRLVRISYFLFFLLCHFFVQAQEGIPLIKKYSVEDYHAGIENWDAIEDNNGILYFANTAGVLEYDGVHWHLIQTKSGTATRSLAKDSSGTIYVGGDYDLGYLRANSVGEKEYISLMDKCPKEIRSLIKNVWKVFVFQNKIFFLTEGSIIIFDSQKQFIKIVKSDIYLRSVFVINNGVYAYSNSKGILYFDEQKLDFTIFYTKPELLNRSIEFISAHPKGGIRYHLFDEGFYRLYDGTITIEKKTTTNNLDTDYIFCQEYLGNELVVGTTIGGLYVIDSDDLTTKYHFDKQFGLIDNKIFAVYQDCYKNIWVCHENGLSYIGFNTPIRFFDERININGVGLCSEIFKGYVFLGTSHGLFSCKENPDAGFSNFELFESLRQPIFFLKEHKTKLLIGTLHGLFQYDGKNLENLSESNLYKNVRAYPLGEDYYITSTSKGFQLLQYKNGFNVLTDIVGAKQEIFDFEIDLNGHVWIIDSENKLFRGELNKTLDSITVFPPFNETLDSKIKYLSLTTFNNNIILGTNSGLYKYNIKSKSISKISSGIENKIDKASIPLVFNQNNSNLWLQSSNFQQGNLDYTIEVLSKGFSNINTDKNFNLYLYLNKIFSFDNYTDSTLAIGVSEGFLLYNLNFKRDKLSRAQTYIRSVIFKDKNDTILINGLWKGIGNISTIMLQGDVTTVEFNCAANYYYSPDKILYSYKLDGIDSDWSEWTSENKINYTIQEYGIYTFNVRTTNDHIHLSNETSYRFTIHKPWYQTYWFYAIEIGTLTLLMSLSIYFNRKGSSKISRISAIIIILTVLTAFEIMSELMQDWLDAQGVTIFALKIIINIIIALSINPIESWLRRKLFFSPINK
ncbi:triple tyrosine motif-containing protein [uncultured Cytophaga sp.]|uniref:triple tyrosine motif-containing protein n=1 Tax=uncultured Cytophaga sp. TaxID=160238 RepID=UPI002628CDF7|nr:triple tyrosine motif-containing protein [uncultured Cytophaga sp.]